MNFFKLYIGDYQRDTAHLSITEHGAYLLMLQHYYATEKPLPAGKALHRMLRATEKVERDAIDAVASQFWRTTDAGLVNDRADAEVMKASTQADTNRATAIAREQARRQHEDSTNRATNGATKPAPRARNHSHSQTPDTKNQERASASPPPSRAPEDDPPTPTQAGLVCRAMKAAGLQAVNPGDPRLVALLEQGATEAEFAGIAAEAVAKGKGFAWVLAVLQARRSEAAEIKLAPEPEQREPQAAAATQRYLAEQRLTPEQKAKADKARALAMTAVRITL